jgi:hypothetical protein
LEASAEKPSSVPAASTETFPESEPKNDVPLPQTEGTDWSKSYHGLSSQAFSREIADILLAPIDPLDVEMKPGTHIWSPSGRHVALTFDVQTV